MPLVFAGESVFFFVYWANSAYSLFCREHFRYLYLSNQLSVITIWSLPYLKSSPDKSSTPGVLLFFNLRMALATSLMLGGSTVSNSSPLSSNLWSMISCSIACELSNSWKYCFYLSITLLLFAISSSSLILHNVELSIKPFLKRFTLICFPKNVFFKILLHFY